MDAICSVAQERGVPVVEDNAHGLFARYRGSNLGTFGPLATLSFHETKNFICGEGGALIINDKQYSERAEILREKGTDRSRFFRGEVDKYTWVDVGSSYVPSDILAAFLIAQLEGRERILRKRRRIFEYYLAELGEWACDNGVRLPVIPAECESSYHMFHMILPSLEDRQELIRHLDAKGILAVFHYVSLHLSEMGRKWGYQEGDLPVTEATSERLLRLPFYNDLDVIQQEHVCSAIKEFRCR
jgi:dTDP-4-amino-4,6-dideoxygalactose transaminase